MSSPQPQLQPDNIYAPPQAELSVTQPAQPASAPPFYVVSTTKVALLSIATFGLYSLYWFWRHWTLHKLDKKRSLWPIPRAIFAVFFVHSLNQEIDLRLRRSGNRYSWSPGMWATIYVFSVIAARVSNRLLESVLSPAMSLALLLLLLTGMTVALVNAQRAANLACGDPNADLNSRFTIANWAWLALGCFCWLMLLVGLLRPIVAD
jgi:cell division protein FtsW (lipid II flippase)